MQLNLKELGLDYLDMALMHFPIGNSNGTASYDYVDTWRNMEKLVTSKTARFIGISNFNVEQVNDLLRSATIKPKSTSSRHTRICSRRTSSPRTRAPTSPSRHMHLWATRTPSMLPWHA